MDDLVDVEDIEALFRAHYARLVRALTLVSGDAELAADAVQEAFARAHVRWRRVRHFDDPVGWIRRVAINKLRDEHRRARRKGRALERLAGRPDEAVAEPALRDAALAAALASLPRQQRLSLALHYVADLSVAEVAAALGVSEGTVKFHLHEGRTRMRRTLAPTAEDGGDHREAQR